MTLQCLILSNYDVPVSAPIGTDVGVILNRSPGTILYLADSDGGAFCLAFLHQGPTIRTANIIDPRRASFKIVVRETEQSSGLRVETGMLILVQHPVPAPVNISQGSTVTVTVGGLTPTFVVEDEAESISDAFARAIRKQPESERNVVIPKTMIALYSQKHSNCVLTKEVEIFDKGKMRATHVCLPDDRYDYQHQFPDAIVLGPVVGGLT